MKDAVVLIVEERERQIAQEGYTPTHDDMHDAGDMARAAAFYAMPEQFRNDSIGIWPWRVTDYKPGDRIRELVKAGALIVAEIERLQRLT